MKRWRNPVANLEFYKIISKFSKDPVENSTDFGIRIYDDEITNPKSTILVFL